MGARWIWQDEVTHPNHPPTGAQLLLQKGFYKFDDGSPDDPGLRFVWRLANGKLQARGPARIDSVTDIVELAELGRKKGW